MDEYKENLYKHRGGVGTADTGETVLPFIETIAQFPR